MQVLFSSRHRDANELRDIAERRVRFVLRRRVSLVPRVTLSLSDVNGMRGGVDKRCRVVLQTAGSGTVVVTALARTWRNAIDGALARAAASLLRDWRRAHATRPLERRAFALES